MKLFQGRLEQSDFNVQWIGGTMEILLEKPALNNFEAYWWQKSKNQTVFKGNHSMESKMTEYSIILLHKYKVEQAELISRLLLTFLLTNYKNIWSDRNGQNIYIFLLHFHTSLTVAILRQVQEIFESIQSTQSKCR